MTVILYSHPDDKSLVVGEEPSPPADTHVAHPVPPEGGPGGDCARGHSFRVASVAAGGEVGLQDSLEEPIASCDCHEPLLAVKKSYRSVGKRERQIELFP